MHKRLIPTTIFYKQRATLGVSVRNRNDYADYDYLDKLSKKELLWLKGFHREFINSDFKHKYKKHYTTKSKKLSIYSLNNLRNRCVYNKSKWSGKLLLGYTVGYENAKSINPENILIQLIDYKYK